MCQSIKHGFANRCSNKKPKVAKDKVKEKIRDKGRPVHKKWQKRDGSDSSVLVNNIFDRLQKELEVNGDKDKIVDDILVENGESIVDIRVDTSNVRTSLTLSYSAVDDGVTPDTIAVEGDEQDIVDAMVEVQQVPSSCMVTERVAIEVPKL